MIMILAHDPQHYLIYKRLPQPGQRAQQLIHIHVFHQAPHVPLPKQVHQQQALLHYVAQPTTVILAQYHFLHIVWLEMVRLQYQQHVQQIVR